MFDHVQKGQPLRIPANDWNAVCDMAKNYYQKQLNKVVPADSPLNTLPNTTIIVKNTTGEDLPFGGVVSIDGVLIDPDSNPAEFKFRTTFTAVKPRIFEPTYHIYEGHFGITIEPIPEDGFGRVVIAGYAVCQFTRNESWHQYADVTVDDCASLHSDAGGHFKIIYYHEGLSEDWGVVQFNNKVPQYYGKLTSSFNGYGDVNLLYYDGTTPYAESSNVATVYAPPIFDETIDSGTNISFHWNFEAQRLELDGKEC